MSALRIAVLALVGNTYGGESYYRGLLPALGRYGKDVDWLILATDDRYRSIAEAAPNVALCVLAVPRTYGSAGRLAWEQLVLPSKLRALRVNAVYSPNNIGILRSPSPCVIAVRNMEPLVPVFPGTSFIGRLRLRILRTLTLSSARRSSAVVAGSNFVRETLVELGILNESISVVYHGVDDVTRGVERVAADHQRGAAYVAGAAKFVRYANLRCLFEGFARMLANGYPGELRVAGGSYDRRYEREMRALIERLRLDGRVRLLGHTPRAHVHSMMRECDAFLFPSRLEACPFTLLEAMRCGAGIVATTAKPMSEFAGDAALYADPGDGNAFGERAAEVSGSPELRAELCRRALARSDGFRWETSVRQLIDVFQRATST